MTELHQYFAMYLAVFGNKGMYQLDPTNFFAPSSMTSIYSTLPLKSTLSKRASFDLINRSDIHLVVGAINVKTGQFTPFDNRTQRSPLRIEDVIASGSLPVVFPVTRIQNDSYWDGGVLWNTPLSPAINALEGCDNGSREVKRELIVVELFPVETDRLPTNMKAILTRLVQLLFSSKLKLDAKLFDQMNSYIELSDKIDQALTSENQTAILSDPGYKKLRERRKIDALKIMTCNLPEEMSNPADFSRSTLEYRIKKGYDDAVDQGIGEPASVMRPAHLISSLRSESEGLSRLRKSV
jgi:NTE family protein